MPGIRPAEAPTELTVVVRGHSMYPTLRDGEPVVVDLSAYREEPPAVGDVVLASHPFMRDVWMIKRVVGLVEEGRKVCRVVEMTEGLREAGAREGGERLGVCGGGAADHGCLSSGRLPS
mgnify:CR=1 FL=1